MTYVLAAFTFALAAGLKPGPLGVFVIHQTMTRGHKQGLMASLAPLITDGPIILLALLLAGQLKEIAGLVASISIAGSVYLASLAMKIFNAPLSINPGKGGSDGASLITAIKINFLNPSPYLFWLTIGSSYILMASSTEALLFIFSALITLCLVKFLVALVVSYFGERFNARFYSILLRSLSLPMMLFSIQLMVSGVSTLVQLFYS